MNKTEIILSKLRHRVLSTAELIEELLPGYYATYQAMRKKISGNTYPEKISKEEYARQQEKSFYTLLSRLHQDGMIQRKKSGMKSIWNITKMGLGKLEKVLKSIKANLPKKFYKKIPDESLTIIIFDIPEKFKGRRVWLRKNLRALGFSLLQKSVWAGRCGVPEEFMYDLKSLRLLPFLHIFKVQKGGSLPDAFI